MGHFKGDQRSKRRGVKNSSVICEGIKGRISRNRLTRPGPAVDPVRPGGFEEDQQKANKVNSERMRNNRHQKSQPENASARKEVFENSKTNAR